MPVEVGSIMEGKVVSITKFGAFIDLGNGVTGLCHISEIADSYVKEVADFLSEQQAVKVKVIAIDAKGKISLSIRQAQEKVERKAAPREHKRERPSRDFKGSQNRRPENLGEHRKPQNDPKEFESMLSSFLKESDDKLKEIKKQKGTRRGNGHNNKQ